MLLVGSMPKGPDNQVYKANDESILYLLKKYKHENMRVVFDYNPKQARPQIKELVNRFMRNKYGKEFEEGSLEFASCKISYQDGVDTSHVYAQVKLEEVVPRRYPLRIGTKDYMTQGK